MPKKKTVTQKAKDNAVQGKQSTAGGILAIALGAAGLWAQSQAPDVDANQTVAFGTMVVAGLGAIFATGSKSEPQ